MMKTQSKPDFKELSDTLDSLFHLTNDEVADLGMVLVRNLKYRNIKGLAKLVKEGSKMLTTESILTDRIDELEKRYKALLRLSLEMGVELNSICNYPRHQEQLELIQDNCVSFMYERFDNKPWKEIQDIASVKINQ